MENKKWVEKQLLRVRNKIFYLIMFVMKSRINWPKLYNWLRDAAVEIKVFLSFLPVAACDFCSFFFNDLLLLSLWSATRTR